MSLLSVVTVSVRPEKTSAYEDHVHSLAYKAKSARESFEWAAREEITGNLGTFHFVSEAADWAAFAGREALPVFARRVLGESRGSQFLDGVNSCVTSRTSAIGRERLDLSQPPKAGAEHTAMNMVTLLQVRAGGEEAGEELIRKVAQALPKTNDPRRFLTYQAFTGNPRLYWIVSPLAELADLDRMLSPQELLQKAFGAEGAKIHRAGLDAVERMERRITVLRPELSNASWLGKVSARAFEHGIAARPHATH